MLTLMICADANNDSIERQVNLIMTTTMKIPNIYIIYVTNDETLM